MKTYFFLLILIAITLVFFQITRPFFNSIFLSIIIVILFYPFYSWLRNKLGGRKRIASAISIILIFLFIIIPLIIIFGIITNEAINFYTMVSNNTDKIINTAQSAENLFQQNKYININLGDIDWPARVTELAKFLTNFTIVSIRKISSNTLYTIFILFIMTYSMYYLFIDGEEFLNTIKNYLPLSNKLEDQMIIKFAQTTRSTLSAALIIGTLQGILGAIVFKIFGIPSAAFWGLMMFILSVIPAIGCNIIWFPAGIIKMIVGPWWQGLAILVCGFFILNIIDYLLRPRIIGKNISLHP
ncbi:MAG: AI-2E family transporter, partial [bacterium]